MAAQDRGLGSRRHAKAKSLASLSKRFLSIFGALGLIVCFEFVQFRGTQKDMMTYVKEEFANVLAVNASQGLRASSGTAESQVESVQAAPNTSQEAAAGGGDSEVQTAPKRSITAHESYLELRKIMDNCGGEHSEEPMNYWMFFFDCDDERLLPSDNIDYMLKQGKSRSDKDPKVRFNGTDIGFAGQTIDFLVAELFFLHPTPQYKGRYLEIGGYYGLEFSNSLFFEQYLGWDGWLFEPTTCFDEMVQNRPNATNLKLGLCKEPVVSMSFGGFGKCAASEAPCKPLTSIDGWEEGFDFASVDIEGGEMFVLEAMELSKVKVLAIEWRSENADEREEYLKQFGYEKVVRFQWQGWGVADEIYYRPDLIGAHEGEGACH
ncbi:hypothetical protein ACHAWO_009945 [Cyclotella atomus]|uniref:Methyltransferase FkbM domain-containing protein n=1 Tax=Cyclotella atomus TaxID=382360 RepID=A0ABD3PIT6_9STRA